jgi:hypothetical protein
LGAAYTAEWNYLLSSTMPENFLVSSKGAPPQVDIFMSRKLHRTDWDQVAREVEAGAITVDGVQADLHTLEPVPQHPSFDLAHRIWVLQEKLRMAMRQGLSKTDLTKVPCGCGRVGYFHSKAYYENCVACEEISAQLSYRPSRGNCWYLRANFDVASRSWGMLYYNGYDSNNAILFFVAVGWPSYEAAMEDGVLPWASFWSWMWQFYQDGMPIGSQGFPWEESVRLTPPLSPADWRAFTREQITRLISEEGTDWV